MSFKENGISQTEKEHRLKKKNDISVGEKRKIGLR
jgi:hypothetical protein